MYPTACATAVATQSGNGYVSVLGNAAMTIVINVANPATTSVSVSIDIL